MIVAVCWRLIFDGVWWDDMRSRKTVYMQLNLSAAILSLVLMSPHAPAQDEAQPGEAEQEKAMCRYAADHMIKLAQQSLLEKSSRPERIEKRRRLVEDWSSRMENGEDPCSVYADIQQAATTF